LKKPPDFQFGTTDNSPFFSDGELRIKQTIIQIIILVKPMRKPGLFFLIVAIILAVAGLILFQIMNAPRIPAKARLVFYRETTLPPGVI
jgi:hypothetical protein